MESSATSDSDEPVVLTPSQVRHELRSVSQKVRRLSRAFDLHEERLTRLEQLPDSLDAAALASSAATAVAHASGAAPVGLGDSPGARTRPSPPVTRSAASTHDAAIVATPRRFPGPSRAARGARAQSKTSTVASGSKSASRGATRGTDSRPIAPAARSPASTRQTTPDAGPVSSSTHLAATTGAAAIAAGSSTASVTRGACRSTLPDTLSTSSSPVASTSVSRARAVAKEKARALPDELTMLPRRSKHRAIETTDSPSGSAQRHPIVVASTSTRQRRDFSSMDSSSERIIRAPAHDCETTEELYDESGHLITPARLLGVFGPYVFMSVDMIPSAYARMYGCLPIGSGVPHESFYRRLASLDGFRYYSIQYEETNIDFLMRLDVELATTENSVLTRLRLTGNGDVVVPAPLLCYFLSTLAFLPEGEMAGFVMAKMFQTVTKRELKLLRIATGSGIRRMTPNEVCDMRAQWLRNLISIVVAGNIVDLAPIIAERCNKLYLDSCSEDDNNGDIIDVDGEVAEGLLSDNVCLSTIVLGIQPQELEAFIDHWRRFRHRG